MPAAATFGVLYVAQDAETAFSESAIHGNCRWVGDAFEVTSAQLHERHLVSFRHAAKGHLELADLTGRGLKSLGLANDVSAGDDYGIAQAWAAAVHAALPHLDGLRYRSRQNNDAYFYARFNRSGIARNRSAPLPKGDLDLLCQVFNVRVV